jgi:peptide/nickel transport system ATP-binding protein
LLDIRDLKTSYRTPEGTIRAVDGVSICVEKGKNLGLAGESGCGKTTLALSIMRLLPPSGRVDAGKIIIAGKSILDLDEKEFRKNVSWKEISYVFQGSMNALNPLQKIGDQIAEAIMLHETATKDEAIARSSELLEQVNISSKRINDYPFELSGGMKQRVMIAMSLACRPQLVILDEPVTGLDVIVSGHIMNLIKKLQTQMNLSTILISHSLSTMAHSCDYVAILYAGRVVEYADTLSVFGNPSHPYTKALIASFPSLHGEKVRLEGLKGTLPNLINPPSGCRFQSRCPYPRDRCCREEPELIEVNKNHFSRCYYEY